MPETQSPASTPPDYGIDAPGVVRNLFIVTVVGCALYFTARSGLWSEPSLTSTSRARACSRGLGCGFMGCWMLYDSKIGKLRERDKLLDLIPWRGPKPCSTSVAVVACS